MQLKFQGFNPEIHPGYNSKFICTKYLEIKDDSCLIYEVDSKESKRYISQMKNSPENQIKIIEIINNITSYKSKGVLMDSTIYCGLPRHNDTIYVASKIGDHQELLNFEIGGLTIDEIHFLDTIMSVDKKKSRQLSNDEFIFGVLRNEQFSNLNIWTPPPPPPYKGSVKFEPPKTN